jgi:hypothetical protein
MDIQDYSSKQLKEELKRRKQEPAWVRQPWYWWIICIVLYLFEGTIITILAPIWAPFWFAYKIGEDTQQRLKQDAIEKGFDWAKYHNDDD